ncbi:DNA-binding LacI/PurR family transcriptional regulator [Kribbella antiqua]|uniref:DNA-binding LacI/PurR family transcriptional regulator n=1 Tax=Kribbella antiqua TaxID=2512217 RepID=A0A4R2IWL0_9ACTN|nr:substrate-binding domain-containing protein [Kribbella antiqua]TCO49954.1 DNA-binding LacI/PurR family transcriptional regulator [Kribbella antiqua]
MATTSRTKRAPVLGDVARIAGVSVPTVSRVLTGSKPVSAEVEQRVRRAIDKIGYRPNGAARMLVSGRRSLVSVISGSTASYGYANTLEGIAHGARTASMDVGITVIDSAEPDAVTATIDQVLVQPVAGVIVLEFDRAGLAAIEAMPSTVPTVVAGGGSRRTGPRAYALIDERAGGREVTSYLLSLGHKTVHHVAGPTMGKHSGRTEGWRAALKSAGAKIPDVMHATWEPRSGYDWGKQIAKRRDVTAVLCGSDDIAAGVLRALLDCGVRVPEDISVAGFDDQPYVEMLRPALTTVRQDFHDLGARSFDALARLLAGVREVPTSVATPSLVIRDSTGPVRARR